MYSRKEAGVRHSTLNPPFPPPFLSQLLAMQGISWGGFMGNSQARQEAPFLEYPPPKATAGSKQKRSGLVLLFLTWKKAKVGRRLFSDYDSSTAAEGSRGRGGSAQQRP